MASKRRIRRRSCEGKRRHPTQEEAVRHCRRDFERYREQMTAYRCPFCDGYHVGHAIVGFRRWS